jgi:hypothetical protein
VPGVAGYLIGIAAAEVDHEWSAEGERDSLERLEIRIVDSALDAALDHPAEAGEPGEFGAGQAAPLAQLLNLGADPRPLLTRAAFRFDDDPGSSDARHDRHMFLSGASPALPAGRGPGPPTEAARPGRMHTGCASTR